jgi:uncharacterized membrane protein YphA (DoxX/SURF4 family)
MLERIVGRWRHAVPVIVRVILGFTFFMYGYQKVFERGLEGMTNFFRAQGFPLPGVFALVASYLELLGGLALIVGFQVRWFALLFCIQMLVALFTTHLKHGFFYCPPDRSAFPRAEPFWIFIGAVHLRSRNLVYRWPRGKDR